MLAHTVKGTIAFETMGKQFDRSIEIKIPGGMDCEVILDVREKIDLPYGSESVEKDIEHICCQKKKIVNFV